MAEVNFPTEVVDLPSQGLLYPKDSPLSSGKIEGIKNGAQKNLSFTNIISSIRR